MRRRFVLAGWIALAVVSTGTVSQGAFASPSPTGAADPDVVTDSPVGTHGPETHGITWFSHPLPMLSDEQEPRIGLAYTLFNFFILLLVLNKLLFRPLKARTADKHDRIRNELERATEARAEADRIAGELRSRLERLDSEVESLMQEAHAHAEADRARIISAAKAEAQRIERAAREAADREVERLQRELEGEIVERAVERAEAILRERFTPSDQSRLVDAYIRQVSSTNLGGVQ